MRFAIFLLLLSASACLAQFDPFDDPESMAALYVPAAAGGGGSPPTVVDSGTPNRDNASDNPETWSQTTSTLGAKGYVVVYIVVYGSGDNGAVTFDGSSMTKIFGQTNATDNNLKVFGFGLAVGAKGAGTYTASVAGWNARQFVGCVVTFNGVNQTTPVGTAVFADFTLASPTVNVSSSSSELVIDCLGSTIGTITVGAGQTQRFQDNDGGTNVDGAGSTEVGSATTTMSWTLGTPTLSTICAVALKP